MANQQLNVSLRFNADTSQAKKELRSLISDLEKLTSTTSNSANLNNFSQNYKQATIEASKFVGILKSAMNVDTGKLDLSKLTAGMDQYGFKLDKIAESFNELGTDGIKAFSNITKQINNAEVPIQKTNGLLNKMWTTLKNTAKWELSSNIVHGLESALSSAYGYAQDLNKSLNDIRIVSGQNIEQMAKFAEQANKAAKSLSTTTLDYTDASLIFYQQGLTDKEVQERTEVTIKMANAAGESASKVSDQLTAIWNNFYDGSKSLEYYADVMTKLGAATASSTDEISQGLEKFAAVADTIGLSYEYATAALTTVTSNTRESADVVGTAFKTIFSRMQDLDLGETLDDGTTLGSYAQAMSKVGIEVLDTNGNLIEMDNILDQMASKWQVLSKSQQVALAQSVAGKLMLA